MKKNELLSLLALQATNGIGDVLAKRLIQSCGSAEAVFSEKEQNLSKIEGIGAVAIKNLKLAENLKSAEKELKFIEDHQIKTQSYLSIFIGR